MTPTRPLPRIKLDLTADERVVLPPVTAEIFHPYSDIPEEGIEVLAYDYVEAFAEKFRALAERTRPRDLYDVVNLYRNADARPEQQQFVEVLREKCAFKGIELPRLSDIQPHRADVEAGWVHMLNHQFPALLPVNSFWDAPGEIFDWLHGLVLAPALAPMPLGANDALIRDRIISLPPGSGGQSFIEMIRFAAANRLLVEIDYLDKKGVRSTRAIEAYSLRRSQAGDVLLMAARADSGQARSYLVSNILGVSPTQTSFTPRYPIELTPSGPQFIPDTSRSAGHVLRAWHAAARRVAVRLTFTDAASAVNCLNERHRTLPFVHTKIRPVGNVMGLTELTSEPSTDLLRSLAARHF